MRGDGRPAVVVVALGNEYRRDDGIGGAVLRRLGHLPAPVCLLSVLEPLDLLGRWDDAALVVMLDALAPHGRPGRVHVATLKPERGVGASGPALSRLSGHAVSALQALRLARELGSAPSTVVLVGIEGADFEPGLGLGPAVARAVPEAARQAERVVRAALATTAAASLRS